MIKRPFPIEYRSAPSGLEMKVTWAGPSPVEERIADLGTPFELFHEVGKLGGLAGEAIPPIESSLGNIRIYRPSADVYAWSFSSARVDPGALVIAANLVHDMHLNLCPVRQLIISSRFLASQTEDGLPGAFEPIPFEFTDELMNREVLIELEFEQEQPDEIRARFEDAFDYWLGLAAAGGFADETYRPGQTKIFPEDVRSYPSEMTFPLDQVMISDQGFDCLINIFHKLHQNVARISSLLMH
jgi:hypothetical protein